MISMQKSDCSGTFCNVHLLYACCILDRNDFANSGVLGIFLPEACDGTLQMSNLLSTK